jgi:hypothetical protein
VNADQHAAKTAFILALRVTGVLMAFCAFGIYADVAIWYSSIPERIIFAAEMAPWGGWFFISIAATVWCAQLVFIVLLRSLRQLSWLMIVLNLG